MIIEQNHDLPLCRVQLTMRTGAATDYHPAAAVGLKAGKRLDGLCNFATEMQRRGAGGKTRAALDEAADALGASVHVICYSDQVIYETVALKEYIDPACALLSDVLLRPDFPKDEAARLKRELHGNLDELRDDDGSLCNRFFARELYGEHPYAMPVGGTATAIDGYTIPLAKNWVEHYRVRDNFVLGTAGDLTEKEARALFARHFAPEGGGLPKGPRRDEPPPEPRALQRTRVVIVDKPERTQSQILIGQLGPHWSDPNWLPLYVATTAFGGTFTARLMDEVRVKRGLSYGASARLGSGRGKRALTTHVFPAADKTAETLELVLRLYGEWADKGLRDEEIEFAKSYLGKSHSFSIQTADDRLAQKMRLAVCDMPEEYALNFPTRVAAVSTEKVRAALRGCLSPDRLLVTIVGTADYVGPQIQKVAALKNAEIEVVPYDSF